MTTSEWQPMVLSRGDPQAIEEDHMDDLASAMKMAKAAMREPIDEDPDPYGYGQELESEYGVNLLPDKWKARPDDDLWVKRLIGRSRKAKVANLFLEGFKPAQIADKLSVSEYTVYRDIGKLTQEFRKQALGDIETLAGQDLARLDMLMTRLAPGIERGDVKAITAAIEIIKERGAILGYRQGVQVNIEQYVREVAEANGYDPDQAVIMAQRISISMRS